MPVDHVIQQGDCVASLAFEHGLAVETVWNHPKNQQIKLKRKSPHLLKEGDVLHIPDKRVEPLSCAANQKHTFVKKGVPAKLKLRLTEDVYESPPSKATDQQSGVDAATGVYETAAVTMTYQKKPRKNVPYRLEVDGQVFEGQTDGDGKIEIQIPPNARSGKLILEPGTIRETVIPVNLGHLDPIEEISGVKQRLANLGFECGDRTDEETPELRDAIAAFQEWHNMTVTGKLDAQTRDKLKQVHGS